MRRSKIFLGVTTAALAIAGVAAAKHIGTPVIRYYVTYNGTACHALPSGCLNSGNLTCLGTYTDGGPDNTIQHGALFTQGGSADVVVPANKCFNKVVWDGTH